MNRIKDTLPEIRINFSHLLYHGECQLLDRSLNNGKSMISNISAYEEKTKQYRLAWSKYETILLKGMVDVLGVSFYRDVIDVTLAPYFGFKSSPLILNFRPDPDLFIDKLTHELLHVLQNDNMTYQAASYSSTASQVKLVEEWQQLFGDHSRLALVHIPLHALHKYIYLDVLKEPQRLERELDLLQKSPTAKEYIVAWNYVNEHSYKDIIEKIKLIYA